MVSQTEPIAEPRIPLSRDRVLRAAIIVADQGGIESLTMRKLAEALGVEAMSLYYHVANKEALLDGVVEAIVGEIEEALGGFGVPHDVGWKTAMRRRILTAREVMLRHKWAADVIESRTTVSPTTMRYFDTLLGILRMGGFSYDLAHHAMHALGSRALGFSQELFEPDDEEQADRRRDGHARADGRPAPEPRRDDDGDQPRRPRLDARLVRRQGRVRVRARSDPRRSREAPREGLSPDHDGTRRVCKDGRFRSPPHSP